MTKNEIRDYLGMLVDLEREHFMQTNLIATLQDRISRLGHPGQIDEPVMAMPRGEETDWDNLAVAIVLGGILGGILGIATANGFFSAIGNALKGALCGAVICGVLYALYKAIVYYATYQEDKTAKDADYQKRHIAYENALMEDEKRLQRENNALIYLNQELENLMECYNHTNDVLDKMYGVNVIYKKYHHNFAAVSSFYEYFCSGMVNSLEGPDGAYSRLEYEIRLDIISIKLDILIRQLDDIKQNQFMLYSAITEANAKLDSIVSSCSKIEAGVQNLQIQGNELNERIAGLQATSDLNLYINALNHEELDFMRRMGVR